MSDGDPPPSADAGGCPTSPSSAEEAERCEKLRLRSFQSLTSVLNRPDRSADLFDYLYYYETAGPPEQPLVSTVTDVTPEESRFLEEYQRTIVQRHESLRRQEAQRARARAKLPEVEIKNVRSLTHKFGIPEQFFQEAFVVKKSDFYAKSLSSIVADPNSSSTIQDELSLYLDQIESVLIDHVIKRSGSFFSALSHMKGSQNDVKEALRQVRALRGMVASMEEQMVKTKLHVRELKRQRQSAVQLCKKLQLMATAHQAQPTIQLLLSTSDYGGAMNLVHRTRALLSSELANIHCLRHLDAQLQEMLVLIENMLNMDFGKVAIGDKSWVDDIVPLFVYSKSSSSSGSGISLTGRVAGASRGAVGPGGTTDGSDSGSTGGASHRGSVSGADPFGAVVSAASGCVLEREDVAQLILLTVGLGRMQLATKALGDVQSEFLSLLRHAIQTALTNAVPSDWRSDSSIPLPTEVEETSNSMGAVHLGVSRTPLGDDLGISNVPIDPLGGASGAGKPANTPPLLTPPVSPPPKKNPLIVSSATAGDFNGNTSSERGDSGDDRRRSERPNDGERSEPLALGEGVAPAGRDITAVSGPSAAPPLVEAESSRKSSKGGEGTGSSPAANTGKKGGASGGRVTQWLKDLPPQAFLRLMSHLFGLVFVVVRRAAIVGCVSNVTLIRVRLQIGSHADAHVPNSPTPDDDSDNDSFDETEEPVAADDFLGTDAWEFALRHAGLKRNCQPGRAMSATMDEAIGMWSIEKTKGGSGETNRAIEASKQLVRKVAESAHERLSRVMNCRTSTHVRLPMHDLFRLYADVTRHLRAIDALCGRPIAPLRLTLIAHVRAALGEFHERSLEKIKLVLDRETWSITAVPDAFQRLMDAFPMFRQREVTVDTARALSRSVISENDRKDKSDAASATSKHVRTSDGESYVIVGTIVILFKTIANYLEYIIAMPALVKDVLHHVIQLLKHFNQRTCHLVLGAGAMQTVGLKSITAKHLAIASQTIGLVISQLAHVRCAFAVRLPAEHHIFLNDMDKVQQDLVEHRQDIFSKIVHIMKAERTPNQLDPLTVTWSNVTSGNSNSDISPVVAEMVKKAVVLNKIMSPILQKQEIQYVFSRVISGFNQRISDAISDLKQVTPPQAKRVRADVEHYVVSLRSVGEYADPGNSVLEALESLE
eukprot:Rmarinus@m.6072